MEKRQTKIKNHPNFREEIKLWKRGYRAVIGLDEAGRGPLAGPVVAGAVAVRFPSAPQLRRGLRGGAEKINQHLSVPSGHLSSSAERWNLRALRDSKKLTARQREAWYKILTTHPGLIWGMGIVSHRIIDQINIFEATKLAMKKAVEALGTRPDFILLDGNFTLKDVQISQKAVIRGDERIFSCAAASIIAKVTRDRIMCSYAKRYPEYHFEKHKGYGTAKHVAAIKKHGPCKIHRKSFRPIKNLKTNED